MKKHFDVAVLGAGVGALTSAAVLARRGFRVLVLGHGQRPATYAFDGVTLARRPFTFLAGSSPAWARVLTELAQSQTWKRRTTTLDPMFQVLAPGVRLDVPPDATRFAREVERELGPLRGLDEVYARLAEVNAAGDAAFEKDVVWPPGGFWERRESARVIPTLPHLDAPGVAPLIGELPDGHLLRHVVAQTARFAAHLAGELPTFAAARLHGAWTRGVTALGRGEDDLADFLLERVRAHGGETELSERAGLVLVRRGRVAGLRIDGEEADTGVDFLLTDAPSATLLEMAEGYAPPRRAMEAVPQLAVRAGRFVVSILVGEAGAPAPLAREAFLFPRGAAGAPLGAVRLQRFPGAPPGCILLVAETILPTSGPVPITRAREAVLGALEEHLPFVEEHYRVIDSPHDGRPLWTFAEGRRTDVDRGRLRGSGGAAQAEPMTPLWDVAPPSFHGLAAEPLRSPLPGALAVGPPVLPALGQEGELLAALSAARIVTRTDRTKEKMRREMWSKVDIG